MTTGGAGRTMPAPTPGRSRATTSGARGRRSSRPATAGAMRATTARTACMDGLPRVRTSRAPSTGRDSPAASEHVGAAAGDQGLEDVFDAPQRRVPEIDLDVVPTLKAECAGALVGAEAQERLGGDDVAAAALTAGDALELTQLLQRIDANVRVRPDADPDAPGADALDGQEPVAEVRLGRRACTDARAGPREPGELGAVGGRRVHDRRPFAETARAVEELDRPDAVLCEALLDLARLLVRVDVKRQPLRLRVAADLLQPLRRHRTHGVGGQPDVDASRPQILDLAEVLRDGVLPKPREPASLIRREQQDDADAGLLRGVHRGERLVEAEVVELADGRGSGRAQLAVDGGVVPADGRRRL